MGITSRQRKISYLVLPLLLGIAAAFLIGSLNARPAFASGLARISSSEGLEIRFISAGTNDPGASIDPGQKQHVGQCTATFAEKSVKFEVYSAYPGYQCTLSTSLKNLSGKSVRFQQAVVNPAAGLAISQPGLAAGQILQPEEALVLEFDLQVQQDSIENNKHDFSIQLFFEDFTQ